MDKGTNTDEMLARYEHVVHFDNKSVQATELDDVTQEEDIKKPMTIRTVLKTTCLVLTPVILVIVLVMMSYLVFSTRSKLTDVTTTTDVVDTLKISANTLTQKAQPVRTSENSRTTGVVRPTPVSRLPNKSSSSLKTHKGRTNSAGCSLYGQLLCGSGECIYKSMHCDHYVDCVDGSDEQNCFSWEGIHNVGRWVKFALSIASKQPLSSCADYLGFIFRNSKICDTIIDCYDYTDETRCDWCQEGQFICGGGLCINQTQVCDGIPDCLHGEEEKHCLKIGGALDSSSQTFTYEREGAIMLNVEGQWSLMCAENVDFLYDNSTGNALTMLGEMVCSALTYSQLESAEIINASGNVTYVKLLYSFGLLLLGNTTLTESTSCETHKIISCSCKKLKCGLRPAFIPSLSRVVGGDSVSQGSWPWHVALYKNGFYECGATLISEFWLISAAHCFRGSFQDYWSARLGLIRKLSSSPYDQIIRIVQIIIHPEYETTKHRNDIVLLRLEEPIVVTDYVRPVCLPNADTTIEKGRICVVTGFGKLQEQGADYPDDLQEVSVPLIPASECRKLAPLSPHYRIPDTKFCAGYSEGRRDACQGDSGGPLVCQEPDGKWSIYGVTSYGYGCARPDRPGIYIKISSYISWIVTIFSNPPPLEIIPDNCQTKRCPLGECAGQEQICDWLRP